ncbi:Gag protein [Phytophthora palmivora]|uniref:Gag protein n=1 Tax=Phytophthora palmivora TaxID=4796 RepID=A0A2P4XE66_9STRA|nr:Gag protein [Phytophthora palmivora]
MDQEEFPHLIDAPFESVRKMAEPVERIEVFDTYERGLFGHVQGLQTPSLRLNDRLYEREDGKESHFWGREIELVVDADLISIK